MFYLKKLMVHNSISMETIGIPVMVSIGILLFLFFFSRGSWIFPFVSICSVKHIVIWHVTKYGNTYSELVVCI